MPKVFISHSSQDRELVEREIVALLQSHGIETWYSKDSIQTAAQWQRSIEVGLESCDWFLLVMTPRSLDSDWVLAEVTWWMEERKGNFIPVLADDCEWKRFHLFMRQLQYVDFRSDADDVRQNLLRLWGIENKRQPPGNARQTSQAPQPPESSRSPKAPAVLTPHVESEPDLAIAPFMLPKPSPVPTAQRKRQPTPTIAPFDADQARKYQEDWAEYLQTNVIENNSIGMKLVLIPPGEFMMGSDHQVRLTQAFYLGVSEVTQGQYLQVMGSNPSRFSGDDRLPVDAVSWEDASEFCRKLSALAEEKGAGRSYRLPTEAEWEYACRAGSTTEFCFGEEEEQLVDYAWYSSNSENKTHPVCGKQPNTWGLYDMCGNLCEWCLDWYGAGYYRQSPTDDPPGPSTGSFRVHRGGGWSSPAVLCRSAHRCNSSPSARDTFMGFRVAADQPSK